VVAGEFRFALGCEFFDELSHRHLEVDEGVALELDLSDDLKGPGGSIHGGLVAMLADVAGATCLTRETGRPMATASTSIQYLSAGRVGPIRATATVLRVSDSLGVADVRIVDVGRDERLMAAAHVTCRFLSGDTYVRKTL